MKPHRWWQTAALLAAVLPLASCMSTRITQTWRNQDLAPAAYRKVMVAAAIKDLMPREMVEDGFFRQMSSRGVRCVPSYTVMPADPEPADESLLKAARDAGAEALLVCRLLTVSDRYGYAAGGPLFGVGVHGRYSMGWYGWYGPPQAVWIDRIVYVQSRLFDAASGQMVWTCTTQSENLQSLPQTISDFASRVIAAMREARLLAPAEEGRKP